MTTKAILDFLKATPKKIKLTFTTDKQELPKSKLVLQLDYIEQKPDGTTYIANDGLKNRTVWLCNHLFDYFLEPPKTFYVSIDPI